MFTKLLLLSALFISCYSLSIGTVRERNATKREANAGDLFPDWVPFKNKHGEELGEFVQIEQKNKVKKRLALPINFILKAVAEPEGDDYYDKGQGESDGEDYYEKKEWSDLNRPVQDVDHDKPISITNHTDISDIDGVVGILTKQPANSLAEVINKVRQSKLEPEIELVRNTEEDEKDDYPAEISTTAEPNIYEKAEIKDKSEEEAEYVEENTEKPTEKSLEEKENELRKAIILDSVDELKERHAEEQRAISEKIKEEELFKDEFVRDKLSSVESNDKYALRGKSKKLKVTPDYDEYEDLNSSLEDKYKVHKKASTTAVPPKTPKRKKNHRVESGKLSVFRNPQLYVIYDDDSEETTTTAPIRTTGVQKFSSRYQKLPSSKTDDERISFVPAESKVGEPTLFFPKKRKNRRKKAKTTVANDSQVAETVTSRNKETTALDTTAPDTSASDTTALHTNSDFTKADTGPTALDYETTGTDTLSTNSDAVTDAVPASSDHKKEEKKNDNYHNEKGGGKEHHSEHSEEHEEHGKKAYEGHHEDTKTAKGHHDKENHLGKYDDRGGVDKHHSEESGHYGDHNHEEHGKKHAQYEESGKHSKGHSTKGSHDIHKKDEYEKKVEFFEEEGDSAEEEKHGGFNKEKEHKEGGHFKKDNLKSGHEHHAKGESGHYHKGGHTNVHKGHKQASGHDGHGKHGNRHWHKDGHEGGRKWVYHHGFPAKTANLVVIDRRADQYYHGPHYYG